MNLNQPLKILIVDDDKSIRDSFRYFLEDRSFIVLEAEKGKEGLEIFEIEKPDITFIDLKLPDIEGLEILSAIKNRSKDVPVIVISARGTINDAIEALRLGAWDYLIKPIQDMEVLPQIIQKSMEKVKLIEENRLYQEKLEILAAERTNELKKELYERKKIEEKAKKLSLAVSQSPASILITDREGKIEYVNQKFIDISGYTLEEIVGKSMDFFRSDYVGEEKIAQIWETIGMGQEWHGEICNTKKNGELFWEYVTISPIKSEQGIITNFLIVKEDITVRKEYESRLEHQAHFDVLTNLPNRELAFDRLSQALIRAQRQKKIVAVMFIDLDQFKIVNDTLGHLAGDELLIQASKRLVSIVRDSDTIARIGGDEFLVILPDLNDVGQSEVVARKILTVFSKPFVLESREVFVTASIGITIYPNDGIDSGVLLRNADAAMYKAKDSSRNTLQFFTRKISEQANKRMEIGYCLRHALENNELSIYYQPVNNIYSGKIYGLEALLRWHSATLGEVSPNEFIPLSEETGLIVPIGEWVLNTACRQVKSWENYFGINFKLSVNISFRQFRGSDLILTVTNALDASGFEPENLDLEITERLFMGDGYITKDIIEKLFLMGVNLSIDDFGTGYSSLSYIRKYPFSSLKVDRSFINQISENKETEKLTKAIISMAHSLNLKVVGEGVETKEQLECLRSQGCDWAQGYYFSRPMPSVNFMKYAIQNI